MLDRRTLYRVATVLACLLWPGDRLVAQASAGATPTGTTQTTSPANKKPATKKTPANSATGKATTASTKEKAPATTTQKTSHAATTRATRKRATYKPPTARSIKLTSAFHASEELRPMAQQLSATRSAAAYAGVLSYAHSHPGEGAAAAYVALGHAYALDHRYADAVADFGQAKRAGNALDDYADYLDAQAAIQAGHAGDAHALLDHFAEHYPDSIFAATAPVLLANAHLQQGDAQGALHVLQPLANSPEAEQADFLYPLARAYQLAGDTSHAAPLFRKIYVIQPPTSEAAQAAAQLQAMGTPLSAAERKTHADALFNAKRYSEASAEYDAIGKNNPQLGTADRNALTIYAAVCDFKLKHMGRRDIEKLPETSDDTAAMRTTARDMTH
jgi:soluble lytic murein transglycosylase